jgi:hypothetical protein
MSDETHEYGSGPIETTYREQMQAAAMALDDFLNPGLEGPDRKTGFVLLVFPYGESKGRCNYISNGASRADMVKLLREQANRFDTGTQ